MIELNTKCLTHWTIIFSFIVASCINLKAQAPQAIPYQAVVRDTAGNLISNQSVSLRFSIRDSSAGGTVVYQETQSKTTNVLGLFVANIGDGTVVNGTFSAINWANGVKFIQVEMDATGSLNYTDLGTQQMLSVPYALFSSQSLSTSNQPSRFGFPTSSTWTCPPNISVITVELWGGGGGGGGYSTSCSPSGGAGGRGGYIKQSINVIPGNIYSITIGEGGVAGSNAFCGAIGGGNGSATIFGNNLLVAIGGQGGTPATACCNGTNGANGSVINCTDMSSTNTSSFSRTFLPTNYQFVTNAYSCSSNGGNGGNRGLMINPSSGENGFCIIQY